jgi:hypothetical protein
MWRGGVIYSTLITARLLLHTFKLPAALLQPLPLWRTVLVDGVET